MVLTSIVSVLSTYILPTLLSPNISGLLLVALNACKASVCWVKLMKAYPRDLPVPDDPTLDKSLMMRH